MMSRISGHRLLAVTPPPARFRRAAVALVAVPQEREEARDASGIHPLLVGVGQEANESCEPFAATGEGAVAVALYVAEEEEVVYAARQVGEWNEGQIGRGWNRYRSGFGGRSSGFRRSRGDTTTTRRML
jgi:hypothetical protein